MKNYEITFITQEDQKEKPVKTILEGLNGKILNTSSLGQKTLAFPIKKEKSGFYTTVNFEIEPEKLTDLNKKLALEEEILRFLIVNIQPAAAIAELPAISKTEITEPQPTEIIVEPKKEVIIEPETEIVELKEKAVKPKKTVKEKVVKEKPVKASKAVKELIEEPVSEEERLDALDKKLEELLKE